MKQWFSGLAVAIVGIGALLFQFVITPLSDGIDARATSIESKQKDLAWMQQLTPARGGAGVSVRQPINEAPYILLDKAIKKAGISSPDRVTPDGSQGARAQFSKVEFDKLVNVLGELENTYGLGVKTINLGRKDDGQVSARLSIEVGS